jgi:short-subunit dehydrogenase
MNLNGKRGLVTGASSGIGRALAKALAKKGMKLAIAARRKEALASLADEIEKDGNTRPIVLVGDLSKRGGAVDLAERAVQALGGVDLLVNNAGLGIGGAQCVIGDDDMARELFETNYWSPLALTRALAPQMVERGDGAVVNVSSIASVTPFPLTGHYASSKAALSLASDTLRAELRGSGVDVLLVIPGPVETPMLAELKQLPGVPLDKMPRGDVDTLATKIVRGLERKRRTLVYPGSLAITRVLPTLAAFFSERFGRSVDVSDKRAIKGGSAGDPIAVAARAAQETTARGSN